MTGTGKLGGVLLRVDDGLRFIPAAIALRVAPAPRVTPVPGAPPELVGVAIHQGVILPVLAIGTALGEMIVCELATELIGLVGGEVVGAGLFDVSAEQPAMMEYEGAAVEPLDVAAIYGRVLLGTRPGRWGT